MKKYLIALFALVAVAGIIRAQDLAPANQSFEKGLFKQAIKEFEPFLKSKNADTRYEAQLKTALAYSYAYENDSALKFIYSMPAPGNNLWKARYFIVKAQLFQNALHYNAAQLKESDTDPARFTVRQRQAVIDEAYSKLWDMRKTLVDLSAAQIMPYAQRYYRPATDAVIMPSVFDFLVERWIQNKTAPQAIIFEQAYNLAGKDREAAREYWRVRAITADLKPEPKDNLPVADLLARVSGAVEVEDSAEALLVMKVRDPQFFKAREVVGKAFAALQSATIYGSAEEFTKAIEMADYCLRLPLNYFTNDCKAVKDNITRVVLHIENPGPFNVPLGEPAIIKVRTANIEKVYMHLYQLGPDHFTDGNHYINTVFWESRHKIFDMKPARVLVLSVKYPKQYAQITTDFEVPYTAAGFYAVVISKYPQPREDDSIAFLNFTDIAGFATSFALTNNIKTQNFTGGAFNIYSLSPLTGRVVPGVMAHARGKKYSTDKNGLLRLDAAKDKTYDELSLLLQQGGSYAIISRISFSKDTREQYSIILNTDRAVYRPGQEVKVKVNVIERKVLDYAAYSGKELATLVLRDANWKEVSQTNVALDDMGGADYVFTIPQDGMLGNYTIQATLGGVSQGVSISVEEYKRPEFEINLKGYEGVSANGKPLAVEGNAVYYNGMPVAGAKVLYSINKTHFIPWFCWWWPPFYGDRQEAIEGEAKTDKYGNFKIIFTPQDDKDTPAQLRGRPARYNVNVFATDEGGRTINASRVFTVSGQQYFFSMKMDKGFFRAGVEGNSIAVKMVNADEKPLSGKATAQIYTAKLDDTQPDNNGIIPLARIMPPNGNMPQVKEENLVSSSQVSFRIDGGAASVALPQLPEGYYILKLTAEGKEDEGRLVFMVVDIENPDIELPGSTTIAENADYYPGETAVILLGASNAKGPKYVEIYKEQFLLKNQTLNKPGPAILEIPVLDTYRGGININWFSLYDYNSFSGSLSVGAPTRNTKLDISITAPDIAEPGQEFKAALNIRDENGLGVTGRALVSVYDKSLDYYRAHSFNMPNVYQNNRYSYNAMAGSIDNYGYAPRPVFAAYGGGLRNTLAKSVMADAVMSESLEAGVGGLDFDESAPAQTVALRENFAETAFWAPSLNVDTGMAAFSFTAPQRLTRWAILAAAFTKDMKTGKNDFTFTTKKDLMIRLEAPRFLREHDKMDIKTLVANDTDMPVDAEITLTPKLDGKDAAALLNMAETKKRITIPAKKQVSLSWPLKAPSGTGLLSFAAVARADGLSDGELKTFPLLPSIQRLAASETVAIEKERTELSLDDLAKDKTAALEAVHLTVDPSLLMPIINAMPFITFPSYETASSLTNAWLPLAIMNSLYEKYPNIREAVSKLPARKNLTAPWDTNEEMLLRNLSSSPWFTLSKGYSASVDTINFFDANLVKKMQNETILKLTKYQNKDGGFAWIKGGRSNIYTTLLVLENMASARGYGVDTPPAMLKNALAYITKNVSVDTKNPSHANLTSALYMAYVLTAYPSDWYNYDIKNLMETASEYANYMTPLGKAHAAIVYHRLGEEQISRDYIARLFDTSRESALTGIYWTPEEYAWLWYNDSVNFHTTVIKMLLEINPRDGRIPKLVKWLMFSRKATMWGNSEQAAKAVYTLLDVLKAGDAFDISKTFTALWVGEQHVIEVKPYDLAAKISLSKFGPQAEKKFLKAEITRTIEGGAQTAALPDFATLSALYTTPSPKQPAKGVINITKEFYLVQNKSAKLLKSGATINVGDEIQVRLTINCANRFDFVLIDDPKPAAFEADSLLSGWRYDNLGRYEEIRDNRTVFFMDMLPHGTYELKYTLRPTTPGVYNAGAAQMQSMFAPEFATHSAGFIINVK